MTYFLETLSFYKSQQQIPNLVTLYKIYNNKNKTQKATTKKKCRYYYWFYVKTKCEKYYWSMFHQQQRTTLAFSVLSGLFAALSGFLGKVTFDPGLVIAVSILNVRVSANKFDLFFMQNSGAAAQQNY